MCIDPLTAITLGSAVFGGISSFSQSSAARDQANYQAAVQRNNEIISEQRAQTVERKGREEERLHRRQVAQLKGRQLVSLAGSGVDVTTGDSVDLLAETAELGERDAHKIRENTQQAAYDERLNALSFRNEARLYDAKAANENPLLAGTTSLLTGAAPIASKWFSKSGKKAA